MEFVLWQVRVRKEAVFFSPLLHFHLDFPTPSSSYCRTGIAVNYPTEWGNSIITYYKSVWTHALTSNYTKQVPACVQKITIGKLHLGIGGTITKGWKVKFLNNKIIQQNKIENRTPGNKSNKNVSSVYEKPYKISEIYESRHKQI